MDSRSPVQFQYYAVSGVSRSSYKANIINLLRVCVCMYIYIYVCVCVCISHIFFKYSWLVCVSICKYTYTIFSENQDTRGSIFRPCVCMHRYTHTHTHTQGLKIDPRVSWFPENVFLIFLPKTKEESIDQNTQLSLEAAPAVLDYRKKGISFQRIHDDEVYPLINFQADTQVSI